MKRIIVALLALCLMMCGLPFGSSAYSHKFSYDNGIEVVIDCEGIDYDKMQFIADSLAGVNNVQDEGVSSYGLLCIFGHDIKYGTSQVTYHNASTTEPKCKIVAYNVESCQREGCTYFEKTEQSTTWLADCH